MAQAAHQAIAAAVRRHHAHQATAAVEVRQATEAVEVRQAIEAAAHQAIEAAAHHLHVHQAAIAAEVQAGATAEEDPAGAEVHPEEDRNNLKPYSHEKSSINHFTDSGIMHYRYCPDSI